MEGKRAHPPPMKPSMPAQSPIDPPGLAPPASILRPQQPTIFSNELLDGILLRVLLLECRDVVKGCAHGFTASIMNTIADNRRQRIASESVAALPPSLTNVLMQSFFQILRTLQSQTGQDHHPSPVNRRRFLTG